MWDTRYPRRFAYWTAYLTSLSRVVPRLLLAWLLAFGAPFQPAGAQSWFEKAKAKAESTLKAKRAKAESTALARARGQVERSLGLAPALVEERSRSPEMRASANQARALFTSHRPNPFVEVYDPSSPRKDELVARYRLVSARIAAKRTLSDQDVLEYSVAALPFFRFLALRGEGPNTAVVMPGERRRLRMLAYCMDLGTPAPNQSDQLTFVRWSGRLIRTDGEPVFRALMRYSAQHPSEHAAIQNLVWGMRHAKDKRPHIKELSPEQVALLNRAMPNGAVAYRRYLSGTGENFISQALQEQYEKYLAQLQQRMGRPLPPASSSGFSQTDVRQALDLLREAPITEGASSEGSEYTFLTPGVGVRSVSTSGAQSVELEVQNNSCEPYTFDGSEYAGQSERVTQRLALGGIEGKPTAGQYAEAENIIKHPLGPGNTRFIPDLDRQLGVYAGAATTASAAGTRGAYARPIASGIRQLIGFIPAVRAVRIIAYVGSAAAAAVAAGHIVYNDDEEGTTATSTTVAGASCHVATGDPGGGCAPGDEACLERQQLLEELKESGVKHNPEKIVRIGRDQNGNIKFLETGDARSGLQHILERHTADFANRGITQGEIGSAVFDAVTKGRLVSSQGARPIYEVIIRGQAQRMTVIVGDNGYIVTAYPAPLL